MPDISITLNDPGRGVVVPSSSTPLIYGPCSGGTANVFESFNSIPDLLTAHPQGPAVECATNILQNAGGPIRFMKSAGSVAAANSAVAQTGAGPAVTVSGTALDDYEFTATILLGGALGTATFKYSLDGGYTYSPTLTVPVGGSFVLTNTGLTLTFPSGTYILGETYTFTSTAAMWNSADLTAAFTALTADFTSWDFMVAAGRHATASAAATLGAALNTALNGLTTSYRYARALIDAGDEAHAAVLTAYAAVATPRVAYCYRGQRRSSAKGFTGWGSPLLGSVDVFGLMASKALISTDLARFASGAIDGTVGTPEYDEEKTGALDGAKISTLRTLPGVNGVYIKNARLKSAVGSDFEYWQHGRVMDTAARSCYLAHLQYLSEGLRTGAGGAIDERDRLSIEDEVTSKLNAVLTQPNNARGTAGHVSSFSYAIDQAWNLQSTGILKAELSIVPLGYAKAITLTLGYKAALVLPAAA